MKLEFEELHNSNVVKGRNKEQEDHDVETKGEKKSKMTVKKKMTIKARQEFSPKQAPKYQEK